MAVVIDVLRATTVMVRALASGCEAVIPCLEIEDARRAAAAFAPGRALLGGERLGLPIEGFDLGNSPGDYTSEVCAGKSLVMTTTNGTKAILSCLDAERVLVASFANVGATWRVLDGVRETHPIHLVCAGTNGEISLEDTMLAGELLLWTAGRLGGLGHWSDISKRMDCNDQAFLAAATAWDIGGQTGGGGSRELRRGVLAKGKGGRRVTEIGLAPDLDEAAGPRAFDVVAELARDPVRIIRSR